MTPPPPYALLLELTHRCPLHCVYCSNPLRLVAPRSELTTSTWLRVLREAAALGVVHAHISGGEPLLRDDLDALVTEAASLEIYAQLTTSGVGLDDPRARRLARSGLACVQLSVQADTARTGDRIAGHRAHEAKRRAAAAVLAAGLPLTINVVLHRFNIDAVPALIGLAQAWGAGRLELANAQYYNWAFVNRTALLPSAAQVATARAAVEGWREGHGSALQIAWVMADYVNDRPKPCMGGWGRLSMTIAPDGRALPCPAAETIGSLSFDSVTDRPLRWLWEESAAFRAYRGTDWMMEPCRSCDRRTIDFGGCRCQAYRLTGDARQPDPVCALSPAHETVVRARADAAAWQAVSRNGELVHRRHPRQDHSGGPHPAAGDLPMEGSS
jgi:pyrroloquinoline quinone biosynthesis protein E